MRPRPSRTPPRPAGPHTVRLLLGTPDANHDGIPDMWAVMNDGSVRMYTGGATAVGSYTTVVSNGWEGKLTVD
ncbi:hypothetical protein E4K10_49550 [Streptomyces sp. T1317-0309]|nr:hypothetical protein E4K10_49550 [Streptomyces sp. T1317-0309]